MRPIDQYGDHDTTNEHHYLRDDGKIASQGCLQHCHIVDRNAALSVLLCGENQKKTQAALQMAEKSCAQIKRGAAQPRDVTR